MENADLLKPWQLAREQYKQRKRLVGDREKATLARLRQFSQTLKTAGGGSGAAPDNAEDAEVRVEQRRPRSSLLMIPSTPCLS